MKNLASTLNFSYRISQVPSFANTQWQRNMCIVEIHIATNVHRVMSFTGIYNFRLVRESQVEQS